MRRTQGSLLSSLRFVFHELRAIRGRVRDRDGKSLSGVEVRVRYINSERSLLLDDGMVAITDASGEFSVSAAAGQRRFVVDAFLDGWVPRSSGVLGYGSVERTGGGSSSLASVLIELESRGASVSGQVTTPSGPAAPGVPVLISVRPQAARTATGGIQRPFGSKFVKRVVTDSSGRFEVLGLPPGALAVVAIRRGVRIPVQRFATSEGDSVTADFVLPE